MMYTNRIYSLMPAAVVLCCTLCTGLMVQLWLVANMRLSLCLFMYVELFSYSEQGERWDLAVQCA